MVLPSLQCYCWGKLLLKSKFLAIILSFMPTFNVCHISTQSQFTIWIKLWSCDNCQSMKRPMETGYFPPLWKPESKKIFIFTSLILNKIDQGEDYAKHSSFCKLQNCCSTYSYAIVLDYIQCNLYKTHTILFTTVWNVGHSTVWRIVLSHVELQQSKPIEIDYFRLEELHTGNQQD